MLKSHYFKLDHDFHLDVGNSRNQNCANFCVRRQNFLPVKGRHALKFPLVCSDAILGHSSRRNINDTGVFHSRHSVSLMIHQSIFI